MDVTFGGVAMQLDSAAPADRRPRLPMLGFVLGTALSMWFWALFGSIVWAWVN